MVESLAYYSRRIRMSLEVRVTNQVAALVQYLYNTNTCIQNICSVPRLNKNTFLWEITGFVLPFLYEYLEYVEIQIVKTFRIQTIKTILVRPTSSDAAQRNIIIDLTFLHACQLHEGITFFSFCSLLLSQVQYTKLHKQRQWSEEMDMFMVKCVFSIQYRSLTRRKMQIKKKLTIAFFVGSLIPYTMFDEQERERSATSS